jgi:hypothetical protein
MGDRALIRIVVPLDPNIGSKNRGARMHPAKRTRIKNEALETARMAWKAAGKPRAKAFPVTVFATVRRGRTMDTQNIVHSTTWAAMIDGIFRDGVTPDDSPAYVVWAEIVQQAGKGWARRPDVELDIYEAEE